jgi:PAS domain S-box-containing protein
MIIEAQPEQGSPIGSARLQSILWIAAIALIYFLVARFSLSFIFKPEGIAAIWPPSGIFLSAILLTRRNLRPYLIVALFLTDLAAEMLAGIPPVVSLVYSVSLAGDALLGAWLFRRFAGERPNFRQARQVIGFLLLCVLLSNALASILAALASAIFLKSPFGTSWLWWCSSDGVGSLLVTPLVMSLAFEFRNKFAEFKPRRFIEGAILILLTAFLSNYVFAHFLDNSWFILLLNIFISPFLIWAALRFNVTGTAITLGILAVTILRYAIAGAFASLGFSSNLEAIILVQVYIAMASIPSILLAAVIAERKQVEENIRSLARFPAENPNPVLRIDRDGNLLYANQAAFHQLTNWELELGKPAPEVIRNPALEVIEAQKEKTMNILHGERIFSISVAPAQKSEDVNLYVRDVTERMKAEEKLTSNQKRLNDLNELQDLLLRSNPVQQKLQFVTENIVQVLGADFARIWIIKPGDRCEFGCMHAQVTEGPHACRFRERCLHLMSSSGRYTHTDGRAHGRVPFGSYKIGLIASGEEARFLTNEVSTDPGIHDRAWAKELGLVAFAGYRLVDANGAPLGVLALFSQQAISAEQDTFLQGIAHITSQVLLAAQAEEKLAQEQYLLSTLLDSLPDDLYFKDRHSRFTHMSESHAKRFGLNDPAEALGKTDFDFFTEEHARSAFEVEQKIIATGQPVIDLEEKETWPDGRVTWVNTTKMPLLDQAGNIIGTFGISSDITDRKRNELVQDAIYRITQTAITSEGIDELYHSIHSILGELIPAENFFIALIEPASGEISFPYYVDQFDEPPVGMTPQQGLTGYIIRTGRPLLATRDDIERLVQQSQVERVGSMSVDWMGAPLKVEGRMIGVMAVQIYTPGSHYDQEDLHLLEFVSTQVAQAIERKRMEQEIRNLSLTDELTGLYNRRGFTLLAEQEVKLAHRIKRSMLLFFGDVDNLKTINDTHGHAQGDQALREISAILKGIKDSCGACYSKATLW